MKRIFTHQFKGIYSVIARERRLHRGKVCPMCILNRLSFSRKFTSETSALIGLAIVRYFDDK